MHVLPQSLLGAKVPDSRKADYAYDPEIHAAITALEQKYDGRGRLLVRPSGTEPLVRVMIEGPDQSEIDQDVYELVQLIEKKLNPQKV